MIASDLDQQLFQLAPLPLTDKYFPYGFLIEITCAGGNGRSKKKSEPIKITAAQYQQIENILRKNQPDW